MPENLRPLVIVDEPQEAEEPDGKRNPMLNAMLKRPGATAPTLAPARSKHENPMVGAMMRAAKKHPLNRSAILRGC